MRKSFENRGGQPANNANRREPISRKTFVVVHLEASAHDRVALVRVSDFFIRVNLCDSRAIRCRYLVRGRRRILNQECFGEPPLQRTRSDGQAFKPTREPRVLPRQSRTISFSGRRTRFRKTTCGTHSSNWCEFVKFVSAICWQLWLRQRFCRSAYPRADRPSTD
jgi:hypothetical protein